MAYQQIQKPSMRATFEDPQSFATTLLIAAYELFGHEVLDWSPATLAMELEQELDITLRPATFDRLCTAIQIVLTDAFYQSLPEFVHFCNILSGDGVNDSFDPADSLEMAWAVLEVATFIDPPESSDPFCLDIKAYVLAMLKQEGIVTPPAVLAGVVGEQLPDYTLDAFSDDPSLFESIYLFADEKRTDVNEQVQSRLRALAGQIRRLPLQRGQLKDLDAVFRSLLSGH